MLTFLDSIKLAYTKLRIRRIRLFFTILTASLLFGVLVALSLIVTGALRSVDEFSKDGFNNRYILQGEDASQFSYKPIPNEVIAYAKQYDSEMKKKRTETAKKLGLDASTLPEYQPSVDVIDERENLQYGSPGAAWAITQYLKDNPLKDAQKQFETQISGENKADFTFYKQHLQKINSSHALNAIKDNKEQVDVGGPQFVRSANGGLEGLKSGWSLMSKDLMTPFVLNGQSLEVGEDGSVPIIIPFNVAEKVLELAPLTNDASSDVKRQRIEQVRQKIAGQTISVCYRNAASMQALSDATMLQKSIAKNKDKKDYQKPSRIYKPSEKPCQAPVLESDTRTSEEKQYDKKITQFNQEMGTQVDAVQQQLTFRVVGVTPRMNPSPDSIGAILTMILNPSFNIGRGGFPWATPYESVNEMPVIKSIFLEQDPVSQLGYGGVRTVYYAEAKNADIARAAMQRSCKIDFTGDGPVVSCKTDDGRYTFNSFGSASLAIDQFRKSFDRFQLIVAGIIAVIAGIIIMGIIGRIIADSRKETAIFRAVGASRLMIAQIYSTYGMFIIAYTIGLAVILGFVAAMVVDMIYAESAGLQMAIIYNVKDLSMPFHFYGIDITSIGVIIGAIALTVFVGMLFPILANVRRRPITDMRDE